jgi:hypothetical protein
MRKPWRQQVSPEATIFAMPASSGDSGDPQRRLPVPAGNRIPDSLNGVARIVQGRPGYGVRVDVPCSLYSSSNSCSSTVAGGFSSQIVWSAGISPRSTARFITRTTMAQ